MPPSSESVQEIRLVSLQVGQPRERLDARGVTWTTGFGKLPVQGPVQVGTLGLDGDGVADKRYHGGADMALMAYSAEHYPAWRAELGLPDFPLGGFGENLSVLGVTEASACIGDLWTLGGAVLQIASPRKPCRSLSRFWGRPLLLKQVEASGRFGFYLRVLQEGPIQAGQEITLAGRPHPDWTVARAMAVGRARKRAPAQAKELIACAALSERWKLWLRGEARI